MAKRKLNRTDAASEKAGGNVAASSAAQLTRAIKHLDRELAELLQRRAELSVERAKLGKPVADSAVPEDSLAVPGPLQPSGLAPIFREIAAACRANDVKRLELFGSRSRDDASASSDADFIVEFNDPLRAGLLDRYLALRDALEKIVGFPVDLIESSAVESPVLRQRIDESRKLVYAA